METGFLRHEPNGVEAINSDSFDEDVLGANTPVLIEFWAARCAACARVAPELARAQKALLAAIRLFMLNVDEEPDAAARCNVRSIPATLLFENGVEVARVYGSVDCALLLEFLAQNKIH
jgi:thioredoxin 1